MLLEDLEYDRNKKRAQIFNDEDKFPGNLQAKIFEYELCDRVSDCRRIR